MALVTLGGDGGAACFAVPVASAVGDVILDGTNLQGDRVNVAIQLEAACPVGHLASGSLPR